MENNTGAAASLEITAAPEVEQTAQQTTANTTPKDQSKPTEVAKESTKPIEPPKRYKLKVDGTTTEVEEQELIRRAQLSTAANKRLEESNALKEQVKTLFNTIKSKPIEALLDPALGLNKEQLRAAMEEWYKREFIDPELLSPEQRKHQELERRLKEYETEKEQTQKSQQEHQLKAQTELAKQDFEKKIITALQTKALPKSEAVIASMARYLELGVKNGLDFSPEMLAETVYNDKLSESQHFLSQFEGEGLLNFLGEEIMNRIRKADLARFKAGKTPTQSPSKPQVVKTEVNQQLQQGKKSISMNDARSYFDNLKD